MMDVLFMACAYSDTQKSLFLRLSKKGYQFAAQNLQESLIGGLLQNDVNLTVLSIPSLSTFPRGCSLLYVYEEDFVYNGVNCGNTVGFINLPFIKNWGAKKKIIKRLEDWYQQCGDRKVIFVYALLRYQMQIVCSFKEIHPDVKISIIVPDLPRFMGYNRFLKKLGFQKRGIEKIYDLIGRFDAYVVLAEPMLKDLGVQDRNSVVVEGIFSGADEDIDVAKSEEKIILYTGNIGKRYGIDLLMDAFALINRQDYRLWIRGTGDNTSIIERSLVDPRIKYIGPLAKQDLLRLQKTATLLVNPVSPEQEFTNYFFPSKTMEYMASGTPTVMFKLNCLPSDYYQYLYFFEEPTPKSMAKTIMSICEKSDTELNDFGSRASSFIRENKNAYRQIKKIKTLFEGLFDNYY